MTLLYAQARSRRQLHLIKIDNPTLLSRMETRATALCGRRPTREDGQWAMTINASLGHACKDCRRKLA